MDYTPVPCIRCGTPLEKRSGIDCRCETVGHEDPTTSHLRLTRQPYVMFVCGYESDWDCYGLVLVDKWSGKWVSSVEEAHALGFPWVRQTVGDEMCNPCVDALMRNGDLRYLFSAFPDRSTRLWPLPCVGCGTDMLSMSQYHLVTLGVGTIAPTSVKELRITLQDLCGVYVWEQDAENQSDDKGLWFWSPRAETERAIPWLKNEDDKYRYCLSICHSCALPAASLRTPIMVGSDEYEEWIDSGWRHGPKTEAEHLQEIDAIVSFDKSVNEWQG